MTAATAALHRAANLLSARLTQLEARIARGDESAWPDYAAASVALAQLATATAPGANGALLTTREMAESMNITPKTLLRRRKRGQAEAVQLGQRGRAALRWKKEKGA